MEFGLDDGFDAVDDDAMVEEGWRKPHVCPVAWWKVVLAFLTLGLSLPFTSSIRKRKTA